MRGRGVSCEVWCSTVRPLVCLSMNCWSDNMLLIWNLMRRPTDNLAHFYVLCCVLAHHDCFKYLFHHHSSQVPENFIQIWDWLHYLSDLPFSLFDHNCVLLHQHELVICETLKQKDKSQINTSFIGFDIDKVYIGDFLIRISNSQNLVIYGQIFILFH